MKKVEHLKNLMIRKTSKLFYEKIREKLNQTYFAILFCFASLTLHYNSSYAIGETCSNPIALGLISNSVIGLAIQ